MAKELDIKIKVDGQEINVAEKSINQLTTQISALKDKLATVPLGSADFKKIQGDINELEKGFQKAKNATQPFLQSMAELPGALGFVGESLQGVSKAFDLLAENPLIAVFTAAAYIIEKVAEKLESMKAVSEALEKAMSIFGTVTDAIVNKVLKPLVDVVAGAIEGLAKLGTTVLGWVSGSEAAASATEKYADQLRELNLQSGELAIKQAEAAAKINEAKEKAQDANLPLKERIAALKDAKKFEDETASASKNAATLKVQDELIKLNSSLDANKKIQAAIESGHKDQLRWAAEELLKNDEVNVKKVQGAQQTIATLYEIDAQAALRNRRLNTTTRGLEKEDTKKAEEEAKTAAEAKKEYEKKLLEFRNDLRLQGITDEKVKAQVSLEIDKQKTLSEIDTLKISSKQKQSLRDAANADFLAKEKNLLEKQKAEKIKFDQTVDEEIKQIQIQSIKDETTRALAGEDDRFEKQRSKIVENMLKAGKTTDEMNVVLENLEQEHQNKTNKIKEDGAKKGADLAYKQIEFERQSRVMALQTRLKQIDLESKSELEKIVERKKIMDEQANIDKDKELENLEKLYKTKEVTQKEYEQRRKEIADKFNVQILDNEITTEQKIIEQRKKNITAVQQLADSIGALGKAIGEETELGKALIVVQQAMSLAITGVAIANAFAGLGKDLEKGFPTNIIAVASTIALIATAISQFNALTSSFKSSGSGAVSGGGGVSTSGANYADGGMIYGPSHAQGGVNINAQGGEAVMTKQAVTMFAPLLSHLNQLGGGTSFTKGALGMARNDAPKLVEPANQGNILKAYVVGSELTSYQHKSARLKELSTL